ncbi:MAG: hypothetical protein AB8H86_09150 [Polyangiales bacterium]
MVYRGEQVLGGGFILS